ncbi:MAG TPA: MBL fold metallo-hydrolase [Alphaproteobacteria bacterium]|nr:MBL fold metallo-hydrolase [Alphaproteobacteria bacterium]
MKITKIGHCCMIIEVKGTTILTDPGIFTVDKHKDLKEIDFILYTHEHQDHYHLESLKELLKNNSRSKIYANNSVSDLLTKENINHILIKDHETVMLSNIKVTGIGETHAIIHPSMPQTSNIGFFIDERLWYPGDAFTDPKRSVEILALPVWAPWLKVSESIDYALHLKPKIAFPVHDALNYSANNRIAENVLSQKGLKFIPMRDGDSHEF